MLPRRNVTIRKCTIRNVTIRKCTIRNVTDPFFSGADPGSGSGTASKLILSNGVSLFYSTRPRKDELLDY